MIGLVVLVSSSFAADVSKPRQSFRGTIERIDLKGKTLHIWIPGCEGEAIRSYPISNTISLGRARVGDAITATLSADAQAIEKIAVLSSKGKGLGILLLCGEGKSGSK
jgi:hypothetical protein